MAAAPPPRRGPPAPTPQGRRPPQGGLRGCLPGPAVEAIEAPDPVPEAGGCPLVRPQVPSGALSSLRCPGLPSVSLGLEAAVISQGRPLSRTSRSWPGPVAAMAVTMAGRRA